MPYALFFFLVVFQAPAFSMGPADAYNVLHSVASRVPMVAEDHAKVEKALSKVRALVEAEEGKIEEMKMEALVKAHEEKAMKAVKAKAKSKSKKGK